MLPNKNDKTPIQGGCLYHQGAEQNSCGWLFGYNELPIGCDDNEVPSENQGDFPDTRYPYICHVELNVILNNMGMDLQGCKIYTGLFPCNECAKAIIQSGITGVIYLSELSSNEGHVKHVLSSHPQWFVRTRTMTRMTGISSLKLSFNEGHV